MELWDVEDATFSRQHTYGVRLSALRAGRGLTPRKISCYSFLLKGWVNLKLMVRLERLGKLKRLVDLVGAETRDLPACSIAPQPSTLRRVVLKVSLSTCFKRSTMPWRHGNGCINPHIVGLRWVFGLTSRPHYSLEKSLQYSLDRRQDGLRTCLDGLRKVNKSDSYRDSKLLPLGRPAVAYDYSAALSRIPVCNKIYHN
jgi:hypothetical protein